MNFMVTINQKFTIDSQKPERKGLKHTTTKIHHITKGKTTKKRAHSLCEGTHHPVGKILTQIIAMQEGKFKN